MELSLLLLSLAAGAQAWPQIPTDASTIKRLASLRSLPVIEETEPHVIEHVRLDERDEELPGFISVATQEKKRGLADEWLGNEDPDAPVHASRRGLPHVEETNPNVLGLPVEGRSLPVVHEEGPGVLGLPVEARAIKERGYFSLPVLHGERHPKMKRSAFEMTIENRTDLAYYAPLKIGNPPQEVYAQVDTGSYELWVDADCTTLTVASDKQFCEAVGQYEVSESKTSKALENKGDIKYGKGSATISYYTDDVAISDSVKIKNLQFGVASTSEEQSTGVLGLGKGQKVFAKYNTFLDELYEQGFTKTNTFSVGLGAKVDGAGVIAFGGVDTSKYSGNLVKLPIVSPSPDGVPRYWVNMKSISRKGKVFAGSDIPVFLDTGATLSLLPPALVESIANDVGTTGKDQWGFYRVDCSKSTLPGTIDFEFEGITIKVTFPEIIRQIGATCWLGLSPSTKFSLLGDTLMRSMYAVFDNDEDNIYLAQYKNCGSNIKTINKSSDIAGFKGTCDDKEDDGKDDEKSTSTTSSTPKTTAPPKSITTLITTTSGTSAITITSAVKPSAPASGPGSNPTPTPGGNPDVGGTGPSGETPEGSDDKGSDDKDGSSGSDDKGDDSNKDSENDNSKDGDNNEEKDGGNGNDGGNGGNGGSAAGRVTPMGVLASAIVGVAIMAML